MKLRTRQTIRCLLAAIVPTAVALFGLLTEVQAQNSPTRDITFIVPYNPGGGTDPVARQFTGQLAKELRGKVVVNVIWASFVPTAISAPVAGDVFCAYCTQIPPPFLNFTVTFGSIVSVAT